MLSWARVDRRKKFWWHGTEESWEKLSSRWSRKFAWFILSGRRHEIDQICRHCPGYKWACNLRLTAQFRWELLHSTLVTIVARERWRISESRNDFQLDLCWLMLEHVWFMLLCVLMLSMLVYVWLMQRNAGSRHFMLSKWLICIYWCWFMLHATHSLSSGIDSWSKSTRSSQSNANRCCLHVSRVCWQIEKLNKVVNVLHCWAIPCSTSKTIRHRPSLESNKPF